MCNTQKFFVIFLYRFTRLRVKYIAISRKGSYLLLLLVLQSRTDFVYLSSTFFVEVVSHSILKLLCNVTLPDRKTTSWEKVKR